jgi:hypothetical protein
LITDTIAHSKSTIRAYVADRFRDGYVPDKENLAASDATARAGDRAGMVQRSDPQTSPPTA